MLAFTRLFGTRPFNPQAVGAFARAVFEPRKPRHRALRVALGVLGVIVLAVLVVVGVVAGALMLTLGLGYRLLRGKRRPEPVPRVVEGEYRVVARPALYSR